MKKAVIVPDSFKGTLSSQTVCQILKSAILRRFPACEVVTAPLADGGEGTVECLLTAVGGERVTRRVAGPLGQPVEAVYGILPGGDTAVVEMAACAGLPLIGEHKNPLLATTYGVGQLMRDAARRGCRKILLGLGGSCTNDAGAGAAAACGVRFLDAEGRCFVPTGGTLALVDRLDMTGLAPELRGVEIIALCDIDHPLYGPRGAAAVFAPQKGADAATVKVLDEGLRAIAAVMRRDTGRDVDTLPGGGAAGGMGAGACAFFGASLCSGVETLLNEMAFDRLARGAEVIFTGEGRFDAQSLGGKAVMGVAGRGQALGIPVVVIAGEAAPEVDAAYARGVTAVFSINRQAQDFAVSRAFSEQNLALTADNILRLMAAKP